MKKLNKKIIKKNWQDWLITHGLRQPDKIDFLFGRLFLLGVLFCMHLSVVGGLEQDNIKLMSMNEELMSVVEEYGPLDKLVAKAKYLESPIIEEVDASQMVRSEIEDYLKRLEVFEDCFSDFGIDNEYNPTYQAISNEYDRVFEILENGEYKFPYSPADLELLSYAVMEEQGDNRTPDECQRLVACVILNRQTRNGINGTLVNPSIADIINEDGQYGFAIRKGYNINNNTINTSNITQKVIDNVRDVLEGRYICPDNVIYQATFKQGSGVYKSFSNEGYGTTTYFCYE